jgi:hypothetical protein
MLDNLRIQKSYPPPKMADYVFCLHKTNNLSHEWSQRYINKQAGLEDTSPSAPPPLQSSIMCVHCGR